MSRPNINAKFIPETKYFNLDEENLSELRVAISELQRTLRDNEDNKQFVWGGISKSFKKMEKCKVSIPIRWALNILQKTINDKVVIYVWHDQTVELLLAALAKYNPLRCDGKVDKKIRAVRKGLFQQPNNAYRVIIAKATSFGVGINLDDINGNFRRHVFINANFHFEKIHQAAGRCYRAMTLSDVHCTLGYAKDTEERNIIEALRRKTNVVISIVSENREDQEGTEEEETNGGNHTIFPADYPVVMEA
jgi:hypothetical protein